MDISLISLLLLIVITLYAMKHSFRKEKKKIDEEIENTLKSIKRKKKI